MAPVTELGLWGSPTSTLDWCETNYEITYYVAEFWNTITNLSMIIPPLKGMYDARAQNFEFRFTMLYLFLLLTGIGSWMFHMTLLYEMQLLDELPMVWGSSFMIYSLSQVRVLPGESSTGMALLMTSYATLTTVVYLANKDPFFHEFMYGILVFSLLAMDLRLNVIQYTKSGLLVFLAGFFMYLVGFVLWNIDNFYCSRLELLRLSVPYGLVPLTQLHGWWHLLAGYATHLHIQSNIHHRQRFLKEDTKFNFTWTGIETVREKPQPLLEKKKIS